MIARWAFRALASVVLAVAIHSEAIAQSASCTSLTIGQTQDITAYSVCKRVTLSSVPSPSAGVAGICVPTNISAAVWQSFYDNPPSGVTIANCTVGCAANQTVNWTISGKSCTASSGTAMNHGDTRTVTDSGAPVTGTRNIECNNGSFTQSGGTCVESCAANQTVNWTISGKSCTANSGATLANGASRSVSDSTQPVTGTRNIQCNNGTLAQSGGTCVESCAANQTVNWTIGGNSCTALSGALLANGGSRTITDSTTPVTGTRNIQCNNGTLGQSGGSCIVTCPSGGYYYSVTGGCYYFSAGSSNSCDAVCSGLGMACNASQTKDIGSDDTSNVRCPTVASALAGTTVPVTQYASGNAGCFVMNYKGGWAGGNYNGGGTTCAATGVVGRICACN